MLGLLGLLVEGADVLAGVVCQVVEEWVATLICPPPDPAACHGHSPPIRPGPAGAAVVAAAPGIAALGAA